MLYYCWRPGSVGDTGVYCQSLHWCVISNQSSLAGFACARNWASLNPPSVHRTSQTPLHTSTRSAAISAACAVLHWMRRAAGGLRQCPALWQLLQLWQVGRWSLRLELSQCLCLTRVIRPCAGSLVVKA